ncbi:MAG TPA: hypothetical protein VF638_05455 [Sphingomonas sp.]|jgi:hypothetical protein
MVAVVSEANFFDRLDQDELGRVVTPIALAMIGTARAATRPFLDDDSISPTALVAGICKAHALGLSSALQAAARLYDSDAHKRLLQAELLEAAIATIRTELVAPGRTDATVQ